MAISAATQLFSLEFGTDWKQLETAGLAEGERQQDQQQTWARDADRECVGIV